VLTLHKPEEVEITSLPLSDKEVEVLLSKEWLLTNERGGYASSTVVGCNTRRYHGLLVGSLNPPVNRIMALSNCLETVVCGGQTFDLSTFEFYDKLSFEGYKNLKRFWLDSGVHFDCQAGPVELTKSIYLLQDSDTVAMVYDFKSVKSPLEFFLRPFINLRDFHDLQNSYSRLCSRWFDGGLLVRHDTPDSCELFLKCLSMDFKSDPQWWFNFTYREDKSRGQHCIEDLWMPGIFKSNIDRPTKIILWANLSQRYEPDSVRAKFNIEKVCGELSSYRENLLVTAGAKDRKYQTICLAADQFITKRRINSPHRTTILAGFPWFADWGRDAFISLPGLLISTNRFEEAKSVLTTFAEVADNGMIPNRFDDRSNTAYFNSIDASLWFINASFLYLQAASDLTTFTGKLLPAIDQIIDSYQNGTRFGTHADGDGLITAGNKQTQLTWMDAKYEGVAFTPRYGKAVEINALWYNALCFMSQFYDKTDVEKANHYTIMAEKVKESFCRLFWNDAGEYLNDCVLPDGKIDAVIRPNQIFAVSLPFSPLSPQQQAAVVNKVRNKLLTPYGLRTLDPGDINYRGTYIGPQKDRDAAYHQGTIWAYLIGPFVEAYLKINGFGPKSKTEAAEFIGPLMQHLTEDACLGSVSEIFDGDPPHHPRGCIAQAWSVAELLRAYKMINS
jgi:predicted glycogen debranching enzyme